MISNRFFFVISAALFALGFACLTQAQVPMTGAGLGKPASGPTTGCAAVPQTSLTHCWPMDDAHVSGSTITDVIGALNGTASGAGIGSTTGPDSSAGYARSFDGASTIALASTPIANFAGAHSIFCWVNVTTTSGTNQRLLNFNTDATHFAELINAGISAGGGVTGSLNLELNLAFSTQTTSAAFADGVWANVGFTYDGVSTVVLYVNGSAISQGVGLGGSTAAGFVFGARDAATLFLTGKQALCMTYSVAVSGANAASIAAVQK